MLTDSIPVPNPYFAQVDSLISWKGDLNPLVDMIVPIDSPVAIVTWQYGIPTRIVASNRVVVVCPRGCARCLGSVKQVILKLYRVYERNLSTCTIYYCHSILSYEQLIQIGALPNTQRESQKKK